MARSLDIQKLVSTPEGQRTDEWERAFFESIIESRLEITSAEPQVGPDGWPYLFAKTLPTATEPVIRIIDWLSSRGIGLVINPEKVAPDYVFTYGMIWNYKERGQFISPSEAIEGGAVEYKEGEQVMAGPPTKEYLPTYVKKILRQFLSDQDVKEPKILVISKDKKHFDLCFSLESLGSPDKSEHQGVLEALAWFFPPHYSLVLVSEKGFPPFVDL